MNETNTDYSEKDFVNDLITHESAFEDWRYFHGVKKPISSNPYFMLILQSCLKGIVLLESKNASNKKNSLSENATTSETDSIILEDSTVSEINSTNPENSDILK